MHLGNVILNQRISPLKKIELNITQDVFEKFKDEFKNFSLSEIVETMMMNELDQRTIQLIIAKLEKYQGPGSRLPETKDPEELRIRELEQELLLKYTYGELITHGAIERWKEILTDGEFELAKKLFHKSTKKTQERWFIRFSKEILADCFREFAEFTNRNPNEYRLTSNGKSMVSLHFAQWIRNEHERRKLSSSQRKHKAEKLIESYNQELPLEQTA